MGITSVRIGYWASLICIMTFVVWVFCFVAIFLVNPTFQWTNITDFVSYSFTYNQLFKYIAQFMMLVFAPAFLVLLHAVKDVAPNEKKIWGNIGISFASLFVVCVSIHYFIQISSVRLSIDKGQLDGLAQFVQSNPTSGIAGINLVGWTVFFSLASLFMVPVFVGNRLEKVIRIALICNGIICFLGGIGYIMDSVALVFLTLNLGMGGAVLTATICLFLFFKRHLKELNGY
jgi:energy-converting hydrogenase Eha subunit C